MSMRQDMTAMAEGIDLVSADLDRIANSLEALVSSMQRVEAAVTWVPRLLLSFAEQHYLEQARRRTLC